MELIPILAFIVLVATIATFIFAFAAYVLFKIRESRGKAVSSQPPQVFQAEFVTPDSSGKVHNQSDSEQEKESENQTKYMRYTARGYLPVSKSKDGKNDK
jgi:hypothetical protein